MNGELILYALKMRLRLERSAPRGFGGFVGSALESC